MPENETEDWQRLVAENIKIQRRIEEAKKVRESHELRSPIARLASDFVLKGVTALAHHTQAQNIRSLEQLAKSGADMPDWLREALTQAPVTNPKAG